MRFARKFHTFALLSKKRIIRRLRMAAESEDMQGEMELEDDILKELQDNERVVQEQKEALEKKNKALDEKDKLPEEQREIIEVLKRRLDIKPVT